MLKISIRTKAVISVLLVIIALGYGLFAHQYFGSEQPVPIELDIVFSGEQNPDSLYNEIWIYNFQIDGQTIPATEFGVPEGWEEYEGYLHVYGDPATKEPLHISIPSCLNASIQFASTNTSGVALFQSGAITKEVDLYSEQNAVIIEDMQLDTNASIMSSQEQEVKTAVVFLVIALLLFALHANFSMFRQVKPQITVVVILIGAVVGFFGISGQRFDTYNYDTTIRVLDTKDDASSGYMAAISCVYANDQGVSATVFDPDISGWTIYENFVYTMGSNASPIHIKGENLRSVALCLQKDNSYGTLEIRTGDFVEVIDLYNETLDTEMVQLEPVSRYTPYLIVNVLWAIAGAVFSLLWYCWITQKNRLVAVIPPILCYMLLVQAKFLMFSWKSNAEWIGLSCALGLLLGYAIEKIIPWQKRTKKEKIVGLILGVYFAFAFIAQPVLLEMYTVNLSVSAITFFAAMCCFGLCISAAIVILFRLLGEKVHQKQHEYHKYCYWIVFLAMSVVFTISFLMLVPVITVDDISMIRMATGEIPIETGFPYYRIQYLKLLTWIDPTQHLFAAIQVGLFIAVCSAWFAKMHRKGLSLKATVIIAVLFSLCPPNFINQMTSVRDYMCATAILYIGYVLSEFVEKQNNIVKPSVAIPLCFAFFIVMFFRTDGFLAGLLILIIFGILALRFKVLKKQNICILVIIAILIGMLNEMQPKVTATNDQSSSVLTSVNKLILENYSGILASGPKISNDATERLREIVSDEVLENWYRPYNMSAGISEEQKDALHDLKIKDGMKLLTESIITSPLITIKNRLNKTNIGWDMTRIAEEQYGVYTASYQPQDIIELNTSVFNQCFGKIYSTDWYQTILKYTLIYGIWLYLLILAIYLAWRKKQMKLASMTIPMWCYLLTMLAACCWQDQRFYYHILPFSFFMILGAVVAREKEDIAERKLLDENIGHHSSL